MASTNFTYGTVIPSTWLNEVNTAVFTTLPTVVTSLAGKADVNNPTLITPNIGAATATSINGNAFAPSTGATWSLSNGKSFTVSNSITVSGTDGATLAVPSAATVSGTNTGDQMVFKTIAVSGQTNIEAATTSDTLTLAAGSGITITTDSATDTVTIQNTATSALVFLASVTPTAGSTTINFLNTFTSIYDKYLIEIQGLTSTSNDTISIRLANGGVADTSSNYVITNTATTSHILGQVMALGLNAEVHISNCNDAVRQKNISATVSSSVNNTQANNQITLGSYVKASTVSGFQIIGATSFNATGVVRVYGLRNSV